MLFICFPIFLTLPLLAFAVAGLSTARARWRPGMIALVAAAPLTAFAVLAPASQWSPALESLREHAWVAPLATSGVLFFAARLAFRQAAEERYDLDRHESLERCAMSFLGAGLLDLAFGAILVIASLAAAPSV